MDVKKRANIITEWINNYCDSASYKPKSLVVGISGGIDSSVVSALCANTGRRTIVLTMPIKQIKSQHDLSLSHAKWLKEKYSNVEHHLIEMDKIFNSFSDVLNKFDNEHGYANSRARLRMATLYQVAAANSGIVVGTGNKVEDFGVGFYTKYGDGGVDISPIADCTKSQVWELGRHLGVSNDIINSPPTDGLWNDGRNDVEQLGMTYEDLEKAMKDKKDPNYKKYLEIREKNLHKILSMEIEIPLKTSSKLMNSQIGEVFLSRLSKIIHPNKISNIQLSTKAMRSGLLLSSFNNNQKINLIDFFKAYPNKNIAIDLNALSKTLKKVDSLKELIEFYSESPFKKLKDGRSST